MHRIYGTAGNNYVSVVSAIGLVERGRQRAIFIHGGDVMFVEPVAVGQ